MKRAETLGDLPPSDYTGCGTCGTFSAKCPRDDCPYLSTCPEAWERVMKEAMLLAARQKDSHE